jgi:CelD/BcsL family acetyltransferase involved in cellulose biosynthesis
MIRDRLKLVLDGLGKLRQPFVPGSHGELELSVVESRIEFEALAHEWESLLERARLASVFETHDWQYLWWKNYGDDRPLRLVTAKRSGELVGVLPLYIERQTVLRVPVRVLRLVGTGGDTSPDDLGPLLAPGHEHEVAEAFVDTILALPGWDVLLLSDMNPECAFTTTLAARARKSGLYTTESVSAKISFLDLPQSWDDWLKSLSGNRRYRIRSSRKQLNAAHPTRFFVWEEDATLDEAVRKLIELHHKRWRSAGRTDHAFASDRYNRFHAAVMHACMRDDRLRMYCLEASGVMVAMYYFYKFRDCIYLMQSGFDPEYSSLRPGQVLLGYIIEHAIGEGVKTLDFLKGEHRYKDELATGQRQTVCITALRRTPGAAAYHTRRRVLPELKASALRLAARFRRQDQAPAPEGKEQSSAREDS